MRSLIPALRRPLAPVGEAGRRPIFFAKPGRVHTSGRRGPAQPSAPRGLPHRSVIGCPHARPWAPTLAHVAQWPPDWPPAPPRRPTSRAANRRPWSSCTTDRARRNWRRRAVRLRLRTARCDRPSGRWPGGALARNPGTSSRAWPRHARSTRVLRRCHARVAYRALWRLRFDSRACSVQRLPGRLVTTPQTVQSFTDQVALRRGRALTLVTLVTLDRSPSTSQQRERGRRRGLFAYGATPAGPNRKRASARRALPMPKRALHEGPISPRG
jgi:hypothetical protein